MSHRLHPRLGRHFAETLYRQRATMDLPALRSAAAMSDPNESWPAVGAPRITEAERATLAADLRAEADALGWPAPPSREATATFDRRIARILYAADHLFPAEATSTEMWSFVSLVLVPDLTWWRWHDSANIERFVASDLTRHAFAKQYWRAVALIRGADDEGDAWALFDRLGEADFDQIQTRRRAYGVNPDISRALARCYLRLRDTPGIGDVREAWRELLKSLLRVGAFVTFAALTPDELDAELQAMEQDVRPQ